MADVYDNRHDRLDGPCDLADCNIHLNRANPDPCELGMHYKCNMPEAMRWDPSTQTITVTCCCGSNHDG